MSDLSDVCGYAEDATSRLNYKETDLCGNSHGSDEDPLHPKGGEEGLQIACQPEGHRLTSLQNTPAPITAR